MFFLLSSDLLVTLRCVASAHIARSVDMNSEPQGVCDNVQKQDLRGVLWGTDVGENGHVARDIYRSTPDDRNPPSNPDRRRRPVPGQY